jgi:hypothetical protein
MRLAPLFFITAIDLLASGVQLQNLEGEGGSTAFGGITINTPSAHQDLNGIAIAGIVIFLIALVIVFASPYFLLMSYKGKPWSTQAEFFGIAN